MSGLDSGSGSGCRPTERGTDGTNYVSPNLYGKLLVYFK